MTILKVFALQGVLAAESMQNWLSFRQTYAK